MFHESFSSFFKKQILLERVYGNIAVVYHRKQTDAEQSSLFTTGVGGANRPGAETEHLKQEELTKARFGTGLYACYDFNSQLKPQMAETYGEYVIKAKLDLSNFFFLDSEAFSIARPGESFADHLDSLRLPGGDLDPRPTSDSKAGQTGLFLSFKKRVRSGKDYPGDRKDLAEEAYQIWPYIKQQKFSGFVYPNKYDGKVAVIYDRQALLPYRWARINVKETKRLIKLPENEREAAVQWTNKAPDIKNIKRKDPSYDVDFQKQSARDILMLNTTKQPSVEGINLGILTDLSNLEFPYLQTISGELRYDRESRKNRKIINVKFPNLQEVGNVFLWLHGLGGNDRVDLGNVKSIKRNLWLTDANNVYFDKLEKCGESVYINNAGVLEVKKLASFKSLKSCSKLTATNVLKLDLRSLQSCKGGIEAPQCNEIILPANFKGKKKLAKNCKIILV